MILYPIKQDWIAGLPQIPFQCGVGMHEGVVMHQTANPGDTASGERSWESTHFDDAFVHEFIDPNEIVQVANPNYIAYGAGQYANQRFIHLELCSAKTKAEFELSFDMWCQRAAVHLAARQLGVTNALPDGTGTLWGHFQVSQYLGGTDHTDPRDYLKQWGRSWWDVIQRVQQHYDAIMKGDECMLKPEDANKIINRWLADEYNLASDDDKVERHRLANELRKASGQPEE